MKESELVVYRDLLGSIKARVRQSQLRAALSANAHMLFVYWDVGRMIAAKQDEAGWGAGVLPKLALDLKNELPEEKGFSLRNLKLMVQFYQSYPDAGVFLQPSVAQLGFPDGSLGIGQPPVAHLTSNSSKTDSVVAILNSSPNKAIHQTIVQLGWAHNVILIQKLKDPPTRLWYARQTFEQGWSRDTLIQQIKNRAHERQGGAVTNFSSTLSEVHASLAQGLLKDPYLFDFLTLDEPFHERELEIGFAEPYPKVSIGAWTRLCVRGAPVPSIRQRQGFLPRSSFLPSAFALLCDHRFEEGGFQTRVRGQDEFLLLRRRRSLATSARCSNDRSRSMPNQRPGARRVLIERHQQTDRRSRL